MWRIHKDKDWAVLEREFDWLNEMKEVPQDPFFHAEGNVAIHTQMVLKALTGLPDFQALSDQEKEILWAAALLHDVEKRSTTLIGPDGRISSPGHARKGAATARTILYRDLDCPFEIREQIVGLVRHHGLPIWIFEKPDPVKALVMASMEVNTKWLALLARADMLGRICDDQSDMLYQIDCFEAYCKEHNCWAIPRRFLNSAAKMYFMQHEQAYLDYVPFSKPEFEVVVISGLPGAGKDTFIKRNYPDMPIVSLDALRVLHGIKPTDKTGNGRIVQEAKELARIYLRKKQPFLWNATNITRQMRAQIIDLVCSYQAGVTLVYLEVPYAQLLLQNKSREAQVPEMALNRLVNKLEVPAAWEAHDVKLLLSLSHAKF